MTVSFAKLGVTAARLPGIGTMRRSRHLAAACSLLALASAFSPGAVMSLHTDARVTLARAATLTLSAEETAAKVDGSEKFDVFLMDDSFNMREYVQRVLMMVCDVSESDANDIMMQANWGGRALVGSWEKDVAEHTYDGMRKAGLSAAIRPEADEPMERPGLGKLGRDW